ncbi:MAG: GntR family transcriptional regulator [Lachnospiraceae bacterium]|nr:GntR family transcriptional regulator [Lachnospiraceae bacterium]
MADNLNAQTSVNLYDQLAQQIRNDIHSGKLAVGEKIPSEFELSDMYNISRSTVRKAISVLVDENLLVKAHGKGTFVSSNTSGSNNSTFLSYTENIKSMGKTLSTKLLRFSHVHPTEGQKEFFKLDSDDLILEIERLRYVDGVPICVETCWFDSEYDSLEKKDLNGSLYAILKKDYNIVSFNGSKTVELCYASPEEAELLDVPRGSALMLVEDKVYNGQKPLHISKQVLRGDKFKYAIK